MKKSKYYKSILQYILVSGLTKKFEQGLLSRDGDGVEYGARISSFLPFLALPHEWRHTRPDQVPEMAVGRNVNDRLAEIHGHMPMTRDVISLLTPSDSGMGFSNMSTRTSRTFSRCLDKARSAKARVGVRSAMKLKVLACHEVRYLLQS